MMFYDVGNLSALSSYTRIADNPIGNLDQFCFFKIHAIVHKLIFFMIPLIQAYIPILPIVEFNQEEASMKPKSKIY